MSFGQMLKKLRIERNLSQEILAKHMGIKQQSISAYENGTSIPSIEWLIKFANEFNVTIDYLVGFSKVSNSNTFTKDQIELFEIYDSLTPEYKVIANKLLKALQSLT